MLEHPATIETARLPDGGNVVTARGPLDARLARSLLETLVPLAADGPLILDLGRAYGLEGSALAAIGIAARLARDGGATLTVVARSSALTGSLQASGLGRVVTVLPTLKEAMRVD